MRSKYGEDLELIESPVFNICGSQWKLVVYPIGIDRSREYVSVHLKNLSNEAMFVSYVLSIRNQTGGEDCKWTDPDGVIAFSSIEEGNNEWGCPDLMEIIELQENSDFRKSGEVLFHVEIEVYGRPDLNRNLTSTDRLIIDTNDHNTLLDIAREDIVEVTKRTPKGANAQESHRQQQDRILTQRLKNR